MEGNSGYYCCSQSCGKRGIKRETLEQAVLNAVLDKLITLDTLIEIRQQIQREYTESNCMQDDGQRQINQELQRLEKEIRELASLVTEVKHRRPILERLDLLEEQRQQYEAMQKAHKPKFVERDLSDAALQRFINEFRTDLAKGDIERKKAMMRSVIAKAVLDMNVLHLYPATENVTGVKLASPRGFEPRLPP